MRVGLLHYSAPPTVGGVEQTLAWHARCLAAEGHAPVLVVGSGEPFEAGIEVRVLPRLHSRHPDVLARKAELDQGNLSQAFRDLTAQVRQDLVSGAGDVEALIIHNALGLHKNLALTSALWELQRAGAWQRTIAWHHDLAWARPGYASQLHPREPWDLLRRPCPGVAQVAVSESVRRELADLMAVAPESIWVVPPGVDPASFLRWGEATRHLASDLGLQGADLVLLLPSRVTRRKNIEMAVGIIAALVAAGAGDVQLVVTGPPGPHDPANRAYLDSLAALAVDLGVAERIHFLSGGRQPSDRGLGDRTVAELFTLADALLFPSRAEGFGIPILEAGLARLPVFCADIPAFRDSGGEEVTYLPLDASPQQAAEVILKTLAADPRHRLRRRVLGAFTWQELVRDRLLPLLMNDSDG